MTLSPPIRVLVADDAALYRQMILETLEEERDIEVVGEASDGRQAVEKCLELAPDILLLDIEMPDVNGIEATRLVVDRCPHTRVVILTAYDEDRFIYELVRAGATGYLLKETSIVEVVRAIRAAHSGESLIQPRVARKLLRMFAHMRPADAAPSPERERARQRVARLTEREVEVLTLVGQGLNNRELAERLVISETTVKTHVANVMHKAELRDRVEMVLLAVQAGLVS